MKMTELYYIGVLLSFGLSIGCSVNLEKFYNYEKNKGE